MFHWTAKQTYIALSNAMNACAELQIDCTPMEGFDPNALDEILGLRKKGLRSTILLPIGYKDEGNDWLAKLVKVRKPMKELVTLI